MIANKKQLGFCCIAITVLLIGLTLLTVTSAQAAPQGNAVYLVPTSFEMTGGDPHTTTGASGTSIIAAIHNGLVSKYVDGQYHPGIAKSWEVGANWAFVTFKLDPNAKFHDGSKVTAEDVKFSLNRPATLKGYFSTVMPKYLKEVEIVNADTVKVHLKKPWPGIFNSLARYVAVVPMKYVQKVGDVEYARKPIGAGPYKVLSIKQDIHVKMEAVNNHFRKTPNVKYMNEIHVSESATRFAMLKAGEADVSWADPPTFQACVADPNLTIVMSEYTYLRTLAFYDLAHLDRKSPFHDIRVRRAVAHAIDTKGITKYVMHDTAVPYGEILPPYATGFDASVKPFEYNRKKAKQLLKEAGYPNGFDTVIYSDMPMKDSTEAIASSLKKVGIRAKVDIPEHGQWAKMIQQKKMKGLGSHPGPWWSGYSHPGLALDSHAGKTSAWVYYSPPEVAELVDAMLYKSDKKELAIMAREASSKYRAQLPRIPLFAIHIPYVHGPKVKYWRNVPGHIFSSQYEFLELK